MISGRIMGKTPIKVPVKREKNQSFTVKKEGYENFERQLSTSTEGWVFGNLLFGGFIGRTTDIASGAVYEFSENEFQIVLVPKETSGLQTSMRSKIKSYVWHSTEQLKQDIAEGQGELLAGLLELLDMEESEDNIRAVQELLDHSANDLDFSEKLIELYEIK